MRSKCSTSITIYGLFAENDATEEIIRDECHWGTYARPECTVYIPTGNCLEFGSLTYLTLPLGLTGLNNLSPWALELEAITYTVGSGNPSGRNQNLFQSVGNILGDPDFLLAEHTWRDPVGSSASWGLRIDNGADILNPYPGGGTVHWDRIKISIDPLTFSGTYKVYDLATDTPYLNGIINSAFLAFALPGYTHTDYVDVAHTGNHFSGIIRNIRYYQDGNVIAYFPVDEGWTGTGDPVFDQVGGNHGVLSSITDGQWVTCPPVV